MWAVALVVSLPSPGIAQSSASATASNCAAAFSLANSNNNNINVALSCGVHPDVVASSIARVSAEYRARIDAITQELSNAKSRLEQLHQEGIEHLESELVATRLAAQQAVEDAERRLNDERREEERDIRFMVESLAELQRQVNTIGDGAKRRAAEDAIRDADEGRVLWYMRQYEDAESSAPPFGYLRVAYAQVSDLALGLRGAGAAAGIELFNAPYRWEGGSAALCFGFNLLVGSARFEANDHFFVLFDYAAYGRLRLHVGEQSAAFVSAGLENPIVQMSWNVRRNYREAFPVGIRAGAGLMVTPRWGFDVIYQYLTSLHQAEGPLAPPPRLQVLQLGVVISPWSSVD